MSTKELISAVGGAMQEAYEQLERRSLENCLAGCFDLRNDSGEGVYVPQLSVIRVLTARNSSARPWPR